jgi:biopolymer transport protein ExbB
MLIEWFMKGGPIMWALLGCSVWGVSIIVYNFFFLHSNSFPHDLVLDRVKTQLQLSGKDRVLQDISASPQLVWRVLRQAITLSDGTDREVQYQIEATMRNEVASVDRNMAILSSLVTVSPILGLIGTVSGLIKIFGVLSGGNIGDAAQLSGGISEALIATALGMSISVPFLIAYQYFMYRMDSFFSQLSQISNEVIGYCRSGGR